VKNEEEKFGRKREGHDIPYLHEKNNKMQSHSSPNTGYLNYGVGVTNLPQCSVEFINLFIAKKRKVGFTQANNCKSHVTFKMYQNEARGCEDSAVLAKGQAPRGYGVCMVSTAHRLHAADAG
jgi:hypothetical protein